MTCAFCKIAPQNPAFSGCGAIFRFFRIGPKFHGNLAVFGFPDRKSPETAKLCFIVSLRSFAWDAACPRTAPTTKSESNDLPRTQKKRQAVILQAASKNLQNIRFSPYFKDFTLIFA